MPEVGLVAALVAGLLSFLSPCVLPMVPFYLSYLAGAGMEQITGRGALPSGFRRRAVLAALAFSAGMMTVFIGFGATATMLGQVLSDWFDVLRWLAGGLIALMGLHFLGIVPITLLTRQFGGPGAGSGPVDGLSLPGAYAMGTAFAFGWTPCVGPALAAILFMAGGSETLWQGTGLLAVYGIGMTAPFVVAAAFVGPFMRWMSRFRRHLGLIERAMGAGLVLFGVLVATGSVNVIAAWMLRVGPDIGILR